MAELKVNLPGSQFLLEFLREQLHIVVPSELDKERRRRFIKVLREILRRKYHCLDPSLIVILRYLLFTLSRDLSGSHGRRPQVITNPLRLFR